MSPSSCARYTGAAGQHAVSGGQWSQNDVDVAVQQLDRRCMPCGAREEEGMCPGLEEVHVRPGLEERRPQVRHIALLRSRKQPRLLAPRSFNEAKAAKEAGEYSSLCGRAIDVNPIIVAVTWW